MSAYDFSNFERAGFIENDVQLDNDEKIREGIIDQINNAVRSIQIYTPNLESNLYNNQELRSTLLKFARDNSRAKIEILVDDMSSALQQGHILIPLTQQLPSTITIKDTPDEYQRAGVSFALVDTSIFIFKPDFTVQYAIMSSCKNRANRLLEFFTRAWEQAEENNQTRRLSI